MKTIAVSVLVMLALQSCIPYSFSPPEKMKKDFTFCYNGKDTDIENKLNIEGYFVLRTVTIRDGSKKTCVVNKERKLIPQPLIDTSYTNMMFYKDGTIVSGFSSYNQTIPEYFSRVIKNTLSGKRDYFYTVSDWGIYKLSGDTLRTQSINHPAPAAPPWIMSEPSLLITDRNTIEFIRIGKPDPEIAYKEALRYKELGIKERIYLPATFIPTQERPTNAHAWLLDKKWFKCK